MHGLDSQVIDNAAQAVMEAYGWMIDIHDAMILDAEAADYGKQVFCSGNTKSEPSLEQIHRDRNVILGKYFTSLNIGPNKINSWNTDVKAFVIPYNGKLSCNRIVLK